MLDFEQELKELLAAETVRLRLRRMQSRDAFNGECYFN